MAPVAARLASAGANREQSAGGPPAGSLLSGDLRFGWGPTALWTMAGGLLAWRIAFSGMVLTTNCLVTEVPEKNAPAMPAAPPMY